MNLESGKGVITKEKLRVHQKLCHVFGQKKKGVT